jgi:hypothetical protein
MKEPFMNRYLALSAFATVLSLATALTAQETAAQWAEKNGDALATLSESALAQTAKQGAPAFAALFAEVKTAYASDPLSLTRIASLTQYVMRPAGAAARAAYADALLAAAQRATDADVTCFFLDQLRWCGLPQQAAAVQAFEKSDKPGVAALAAMTRQAVTDDRASKAAPVKDTPCAALNKELAALAPKALTPRLLPLADSPDTALAGVALTWARTTGGKKETALWSAKLATVQDPARKAMLLDMLGTRGDKAACEAIAACLADAEDTVAAAAQKALIKLDPAAFASQIPVLLKDLPQARQLLARDSVRQLTTDLIKTALTKPYDTFSETGKKVALEVIKERRIAEAAPLALAALDAKDEETAIAGYRLLREIADKSQADILVAKLFSTSGRVTPEAQTALAAAARRDKTGAYAAALLKALERASDAQKPVALETAGRLGGNTLLTAVEASTASPNADVATTAVRALADWPDAASVPALLRLAATSSKAKQQTLAQRGLAKKLNEDGADKKAALNLWKGLKPNVTDEARKKALDDLFREETNVALGKPVTTDVSTEGNHVPANLTDGTLEKAWHGAKSPAQAQIDLGALQTISAAHVTFYHDGRTYTFTLELSEDSKTWKRVAGNTEAPKPATAEGLRLDFALTPARYARLTVIKNSANPAVHVLELKLFSATIP